MSKSSDSIFQRLSKGGQSAVQGIINSFSLSKKKEPESQQTSVTHPEQNVKSPDESFDDLCKILTRHGKEDDIKVLKMVKESGKLQDLVEPIDGLMEKYRPENAANTGSQQTEIFQGISSFKDLVTEKLHQEQASKVQELTAKLAKEIGEIPTDVRDEIGGVKDYLDRIQAGGSQISGEETKQIMGSLMVVAERLKDHPNIKPIMEEMGKLLGIGKNSDVDHSRREEAGRSKITTNDKPDVVTTENNNGKDLNNNLQNPNNLNETLNATNQDKLTDDEEEKRRRQQNLANSNSTNSTSHHNSSNIDPKAIALITGQAAIAMALALTCGPFGIVLAGFMLYSTRNIFNNQVVSHSNNSVSNNQTLSDKSCENVISESLKQFQQATTQAAQKSQEVATPKSTAQASQKSQEAVTQKSSDNTSKSAGNTSQENQDAKSLAKSIMNNPALREALGSSKEVTSSLKHAPITPSMGDSGKVR